MSEVRDSGDSVQQKGGTRAPAAGTGDLDPQTRSRGALSQREGHHARQGLLGNRGVTFTSDFKQFLVV